MRVDGEGGGGRGEGLLLLLLFRKVVVEGLGRLNGNEGMEEGEKLMARGDSE